jgi:hypothetical protein
VESQAPGQPSYEELATENARLRLQVVDLTRQVAELSE